MRKLIALSLCCSLLLCSALPLPSASAESALPAQRNAFLEYMLQNPVTLPSPSKELGVAEEQIQEDVEASNGHNYDAYRFDVPSDQAEPLLEDYRAFLEEHTDFELSDVEVDGLSAIRIDSSLPGVSALLIPDYEGKVFLAVESNIGLVERCYEGSDIPAPLPDTAEALGASPEVFTGGDQVLNGLYARAYSCPLASEDAIAAYLALAGESGFACAKDEIYLAKSKEASEGYLLTQTATGLCAMLVPEFDGKTVLLVNLGIEFADRQFAFKKGPLDFQPSNDETTEAVDALEALIEDIRSSQESGAIVPEHKFDGLG